MIQASQVVTGSSLQEQIPAEYLVCFPPAPSQYTSDQTTPHRSKTAAKRKANNVTNRQCAYNNIRVGEVLKHLHFVLELPYMCLVKRLPYKHFRGG
jgi:hypothetical protein